MFSRFQELEIDRHGITVYYKDGKVSEYRIPENEINWLLDPNQHIQSIRTHNTIVILEDRIVMYDSFGKMEAFGCPNEVMYYIRKDIAKKGKFVLSYRKHLIWKYDKRHVDITYMPGCSPEFLREKRELIKSVYEYVAETFGCGHAHRPMIIFSRNENTLCYIVKKEYLTVAKGEI